MEKQAYWRVSGIDITMIRMQNRLYWVGYCTCNHLFCEFFPINNKNILYRGTGCFSVLNLTISLTPTQVDWPRCCSRNIPVTPYWVQHNSAVWLTKSDSGQIVLKFDAIHPARFSVYREKKILNWLCLIRETMSKSSLVYIICSSHREPFLLLSSRAEFRILDSNDYKPGSYTGVIEQSCLFQSYLYSQFWTWLSKNRLRRSLHKQQNVLDWRTLSLNWLSADPLAKFNIYSGVVSLQYTSHL